MNEANLKDYYNKFNEDKRLKTRHGKLEFITVMKYIRASLNNYDNPKILDIGAGTGAYSIPLASDGYDVTALELVRHNLRVIEKNSKLVKVIEGNALDLSKFEDKTFDIILLFGPMYHLISEEEKLKSLKEAKRVLKDNGIILVQYIMNDYAVLRYGFKEQNILSSLNNLDDKYHIISNNTDLYSYVRLEDINLLNKKAKLKRVKILTPDGITNLTREYINRLTEDEYNEYIKYHLSICERKDILGLSGHVLDILKKY